MNAGDDPAGPAARLAATRMQLRQTLGAESAGLANGDAPQGARRRFPRSATFRLLLGRPAGGNLGWLMLGVVATSLTVSRYRGLYRSIGAMMLSAVAKRALGSQREPA